MIIRTYIEPEAPWVKYDPTPKKIKPTVLLGAAAVLTALSTATYFLFFKEGPRYDWYEILSPWQSRILNETITIIELAKEVNIDPKILARILTQLPYG